MSASVFPAEATDCSIALKRRSNFGWPAAGRLQGRDRACVPGWRRRTADRRPRPPAGPDRRPAVPPAPRRPPHRACSARPAHRASRSRPGRRELSAWRRASGQGGRPERRRECLFSALAALSVALLCLPGHGLFCGIAGRCIAEHMRMAADHLVGDASGRPRRSRTGRLPRPSARGRRPGTAGRRVRPAVRARSLPGDRIGDLVGFLDRVRARWSRSSAALSHGQPCRGIAQRRHDVEQAAEFGFGGGRAEVRRSCWRHRPRACPRKPPNAA